MKIQHTSIFLLLLFLILAIPVKAQKMTVESMIATTDQTANLSENLIKDNNGDYAGLVKVRLAAPSAKFEGLVLKSQRYNASEYWVFMAKGSTKLTVVVPGCLPLQVNFADYGISRIESRCTYQLTIAMPQQTSSGLVDDGMRYLVMKVEPKNSTVFIDDNPQVVEDGVMTMSVLQGTHRYQVSSPGYATEKGTVEIDDAKKTLSVRLVSLQASLSVECATQDAQILVNDQLKGTTSWNGMLAPGNYKLEIRKEGFRPRQQSVSLTEKENRQVHIPALDMIVGTLNVKVTPIEADVYIDGKKMGTTPDVFRNIQVGQRRVEIRKEGYQTLVQTVTIKESEQASLSGTLTAIAMSSASESTNATTSSSSFGQFGQPSETFRVNGSHTLDDLRGWRSYSTNNSGQSGISDSSGQSRETFTVNGVSFTMVRVDGGTFTMGATKEQRSDALDSEKPAHQVTLATYMIGETEVTQALWQAVMGKNPSHFQDTPQNPVEQVSWADCQEFVKKLSRLTGKTFRLPTEAEWEYAARGGNKSKHYKYSGDSSIDAVAWYGGNSGDKTHPVKGTAPNELGLYDMSGNVWEWCEDWYGSYGSSAQSNPKGLSTGFSRVSRGGGWNYYFESCRVSYRSCRAPSDRRSFLGLRLAQ